MSSEEAQGKQGKKPPLQGDLARRMHLQNGFCWHRPFAAQAKRECLCHEENPGAELCSLCGRG